MSLRSHPEGADAERPSTEVVSAALSSPDVQRHVQKAVRASHDTIDHLVAESDERQEAPERTLPGVQPTPEEFAAMEARSELAHEAVLPHHPDEAHLHVDPRDVLLKGKPEKKL